MQRCVGTHVVGSVDQLEELARFTEIVMQGESILAVCPKSAGNKEDFTGMQPEAHWDSLSE